MKTAIDLSPARIKLLEAEGYLPAGSQHTISDVKYAGARFDKGQASDLGLRTLRDLVLAATESAGGFVPISGMTMMAGSMAGVATAMVTGASVGAGFLVGGGAIPLALITAATTLCLTKRGVSSRG